MNGLLKAAAHGAAYLTAAAGWLLLLPSLYLLAHGQWTGEVACALGVSVAMIVTALRTGRRCFVCGMKPE